MQEQSPLLSLSVILVNGSDTEFISRSTFTDTGEIYCYCICVKQLNDFVLPIYRIYGMIYIYIYVYIYVKFLSHMQKERII